MAGSHNNSEGFLEELLTRGVEEIIPVDELRQELLSGRKLRVKLGIDPTSPHIHIGRSIPLLKLRDFQIAGHQAVLIVGDFTAVIGDTSDKDGERPMLARAIIEENKKAYFAQAGKILDLEKTEIRYNSEWLEKLTYREIGEHADLFSVSDFIARENIAKRLKGGKRVSLREVLYPLMQGYDSVAVSADVELGGTDQKFNLLAGRTLQQRYGGRPQSVLMGPLIEGVDGRKMSSSWGNTIAFADTPEDMYGKAMSLADEQTLKYLTLCTRVPLSEIERISSGLFSGAVHPKEAKMYLARALVTLYHNKETAQKAEENFEKTFSLGGVPDDIKVVEATPGATLIDILVREGVVASKTDFRRLVDDGAISNAETNEKITDATFSVTASVVLRVGKRRFIKIAILP